MIDFSFILNTPTSSNIYAHFKVSVNKTTSDPSFPMHFLNKIPKPFTIFALALKECLRLSQKFFTHLVTLFIE